MQILELIRDFGIYFLVGIGSSYYFYVKKRRDLLGGFWGGAAIGTVGAVIISMIAEINSWFREAVNWITRALASAIAWLMMPKWDETLLFRVNLITAVLGAFLFVFIINKINHDKERRH